MNQKGQTLIEVVIAVVLLAVVFTGLFQALAVGIWGTYTTDQLTTAQQIAQSEINYIKSQDYLVHDEDGLAFDDEGEQVSYNLISLDGDVLSLGDGITSDGGIYSATIGGFTVQYSIGNTTVPPEVLQHITMTVAYKGGKPQQFMADKANVEHGELALCTDRHDEEFTIPDNLDGGSGYYHVVSTVAEGPISAFWDIAQDKDIKLYIYMGIPFGQSPPYVISEDPAIVDPDAYPLVTSGEGQGSASTPSQTVPPGVYTVYFYLEAGSNLDTISATVTYTCQ